MTIYGHFLYVPPPFHLLGGGHIFFDADPIGIGTGITLPCLHICEPVVGFLPNFHGYN